VRACSIWGGSQVEPDSTASPPRAERHPLAVPAPKHMWRQVVAMKGAEMTKRLRVLWVGLVAATAAAAVLTTPAIIAGITYNFLD
jgi:hypothetical protein